MFDGEQIDRNSPIPLHHQLREMIVEAIDSGELARQSRLPSERELGKELGLSRHTVRQTINELVLLGVLTRRQGKGTYVAPHKVTQRLSGLGSFTEMLRGEVENASLRTLACRWETAGRWVGDAIGVSRGERVVSFRRVRLGDGVPIAMLSSYLPPQVGGALLRAAEPPESLFAFLERVLGIELGHSEEVLEPTVADEYEAGVLGVQPGAPLQLIRGRVYSTAGVVVECHKTLYRGDRFSFAFRADIDAADTAAYRRLASLDTFVAGSTAGLGSPMGRA